MDREISDQETDLIKMSQELSEDVTHPNSIIQTLLRNNPETLGNHSKVQIGNNMSQADLYPFLA